MSSAVKLILGVSICAMATGFAACDSGSSENGGAAGAAAGPVKPDGGGGSPGGGGAAPAGGGTPGTGGALPEGVPLTPTDGWVDGASNNLGIVGAMYAYADDTSAIGMMKSFLGATGCMSGTAAKVIEPCTIAATATDCYGTYWGAAMALNLNQPKGADGMGVTDLGTFDASALKGFAFELSGDMIPAAKSLRFKVENAAKTEFCTPPTQKLKFGVNQFEFKDLIAECWHTLEPANATAETVQSALVKISWAVVTSKDAEVPFNFCVSNIRAILKAGGSGTPVGSAGASAGGASAGGASAGGAPAGGAPAGGASAGGAPAGGASSAGAGGAKAGSGGTAGG